MINKKTQNSLDRFVVNPNSNLIIDGSDEYGSSDAISYLTNTLLGTSYKGNVIRIEPVKDSIGIESIRELKSKLSTVAGKEQRITRIATIERAGDMTIEAQNALLKLLEEPTKNTLIILTVDNKNDLLDTIISRCQTIRLLPLSTNDAMKLAETLNIDPDKAKKAFAISKGAARLYEDLLTERNTKLTENIQKAKDFISDDVFSRLLQQKSYDDKKELSTLVSNVLIVSEAGLHNSKGKNIQKWKNMIKELNTIYDLLSKNANTKLVFLRMCVMV